ncbi:MAG: sigma factor-like helix-turn-helix DNA-binding protein [Candidatus Faecousia sp.]|nr:sigma factor-like helix-turn-helix DNA-binding protein [Candidatus Faecousia sp.]
MRNIPFDRKLELVKKIMERELTPLQRQTVEAYYLRGMTLEQIAQERYVNKSTVQRTLKRGEQRIRRFLLL